MLDRSTHCRRRAGAPMQNLTHSASFHSNEKSAPSKPGTKHLRRANITCDCGVLTRAGSGHLDFGRIRCPACGHRERLIDLAKRTGAPPKFRLFAVETIPTGPERKYSAAKRRIRSASRRDLEIYEAARQRLGKEVENDPGFVVEGDIPRENRSDDRLLRYGYT